MKELDVRGLSCPEPVLILQDALKENKEETYKVLASEAHVVKILLIMQLVKAKKFLLKKLT